MAGAVLKAAIVAACVASLPARVVWNHPQGIQERRDTYASLVRAGNHIVVRYYQRKDPLQVTAVYEARSLRLVRATETSICCIVAGWNSIPDLWHTTVERNADGSYDIVERHHLFTIPPWSAHQPGALHVRLRPVHHALLIGTFILEPEVFRRTHDATVDVLYLSGDVSIVPFSVYLGNHDNWPISVPKADENLSMYDSAGSWDFYFDPCTFRLDEADEGIY